MIQALDDLRQQVTPDTILLGLDIDGTQTGDPGLLLRVYQELRSRDTLIADITGRKADSISRLYARYGIPQELWPPIWITDVGTGINVQDSGVWHPDIDYQTKLGLGWHLEDIKYIAEEKAQALKEPMIAYERNFSALRLSYLTRTGLRGIEEEMVNALFNSGFAAAAIYSEGCIDGKMILASHDPRMVGYFLGLNGGNICLEDEFPITYLDFIPVGGGKGNSLEHVRCKLGISLDNTLAAGDSGNDEQMLSKKYCRRPIIVNTSTCELATRIPGAFITGKKDTYGLVLGLMHHGMLPQDFLDAYRNSG